MVTIEKEKDSNEVPMSEEMYPWGTELRLNDDLVEQLGLVDLRAGDVVTVRGTAFVRHKNERTGDSSDDPEREADVCLQLTEIDVTPAKKDRAKEMYGED